MHQKELQTNTVTNLNALMVQMEQIRILFPLLAVSLILILCCLRVFFGFISIYCLPASIPVPILELLRDCLATSSVSKNPNLPATQENIDTLPVVLYSQEPDQLNQTKCAIC
ncbi:unnamed protein product [Rotaria sp. Silwood2]|nr:unnamed protein product [Rotaria sp. Silwood2]